MPHFEGVSRPVDFSFALALKFFIREARPGYARLRELVLMLWGVSSRKRPRNVLGR